MSGGSRSCRRSATTVCLQSVTTAAAKGELIPLRIVM
jgi:hypothetical protein